MLPFIIDIAKLLIPQALGQGSLYVTRYRGSDETATGREGMCCYFIIYVFYFYITHI